MNTECVPCAERGDENLKGPCSCCGRAHWASTAHKFGSVVTPSRPSPPTEQCICEWRSKYSGAAKAHRRTCSDWTQEDADWCAAQWEDARCAPLAAAFSRGDLIMGVDFQGATQTAERATHAADALRYALMVPPRRRSRGYRFRAWLAARIERLAGWVRP